ncbi:hypothetical protein LCGC14_0285080 [marine sediment metagenome]|uniref:DEAD/DEAH box helicase n=1 Tax=marine sediment metagenome TaxID=412755 RepID=A0A0F9TZY3_9ZZZZ|nr:DEAD/DEAH box helicase [Phycisphaerae bacterium]HDZ45040.1 DEAD/DEAH box helicase [Phycisphaerae bacterium]
MSELQKFSELDLIAPLARAVAEEGYEIPTPIQVRCIPHLLKGRDLLGSAQTGTGKTAAFALPILQGLHKSGRRERRIRTLIMTPTRELAAQIGASFQTYGRHLRLTSTVIFGGVSQHGQEKALKRGPDILVATPGRLLDLMGQKLISLKHLEYFVLDEADRMLDMGFIHDVRRVIDALPAKRQSLFFSATMPSAVAELADRLLTDPVRVEVAPQSATAERVDQTLMFVDKDDKRKLLETILRDTTVCRVLVFSRTKHGADRICKQLVSRDIAAEAIHGNRSQNARTRALDGFRNGRLRVLVATDIAARGIDVDDVSHVINFDLPNEPESYIHRIGRTARAGRDGKAISFCSGDEMEYLSDIERLIEKRVPVDLDHAFHSDDAANGLVDGLPAESPDKQAQLRRMERARQRRAAGPRPARRTPKRQSAKGQSASAGRSKKRPKAFAPATNRRRRRPR